MYKRIVLLKSSDAAALSTLLRELHDFPAHVPGLVSVEIIADSGDRSLGYDQGFILTFTDASVLPDWREHPLHAAFRPRLRALCEMLIFDYPHPTPLPQEQDRHACV
ncbi:Dabb family protein [Pseudomonas japonica]|uniref:Stress responsive A/B Barrel Domain n=1 Tax=Pseudomonas japonica TaxID=256466 RepID=A0A239BSW1_9PSED|nr:Dabb family protein [Pseudomonas japonica]SNS11097.1 Stress responsive A/B Barrel Domain [Pseudomonas japonica]